MTEPDLKDFFPDKAYWRLLLWACYYSC